ncbi:MAG: ATP-binding protein [Acidimicrobiia bacterium]
MRRKVFLVAAVPIGMLVVVNGIGLATQRSVSIGSDRYVDITQSADLVADVLPPPGFLVESYLTVQQLANEAANDSANSNERIATYEARLEQFQLDFEATHDKWVDRALVADDPALNESMLVDAFTTGTEFFRVVDEELLPAVDERDGATALSIANGQLNEIYGRHREAIVQTVELARTKQADIESTSNAQVSRLSALSILAFVVGLGLALAVSLLVAQAITRSVTRLRNAANDVVAKLRGTDLDDEVPQIEPVDLGTSDELADAAAALNTVVGTTIDLLEQQARGRKALSEMFVNLGRRNQNLVSRQLRLVDELERNEADSENLKKLFKLDHIATRMRRNAESLLVMAGLEAPRKWKKAVPVVDVLRSAVSEVEQFERVEVTEMEAVRVSGGAAANLAHLVAELTENALRYSPPDTKVIIAGEPTAKGLRLTITDRGTGMADADLANANQRLAEPPRLEEAPTAYLGHFVVGRLAQRHGIGVALQSGDVGITAVIDLPEDILAPAGEDQAPADRDGYVRARAQQRSEQVAMASAGAAPEAAPAEPGAKQQVMIYRGQKVVLDEHGATTVPADAEVAAAEELASQEPELEPAGAPEAEAQETVAEEVGPETVAEEAGSAPSAQPSTPATAISPAPTKEEVTAAGYKKRTRKAAATDDFDRFAAPTAPARTRSADDVRSRLDSFKAGKTRAVHTDEPATVAAAVSPDATTETTDTSDEQGA